MIGGRNVAYPKGVSPKKYNKASLVPGEKEPTGNGRVLDNGALAGYVMNAQGEKVWRVVQGAPKSYMVDNIALKKGEKRPRRKITQLAAQRAFNAAYGKNWKKSPKGAAIARGRDLAVSHRVVDDTRYTARPRHYDFQGVDAGPGKVTRSPKQKALDDARRGKSKDSIFTKRGGYYW